MDISNLSCDELTYELWIRGMTLNSTLIEKRKILKLLIRQEEDLKLPPGKVFKQNFSQELSVCSEKLNQVDAEIQTINSMNMHMKFKQILTRLCHVENRLRRLGVQGQNSNRDLCLLKQLCLVLLEMIENAYEIEKVTLVYKNQTFIDHVLAKVSFKASQKKPIENTCTHSTDIPTSVTDKPILEVCSKYTDLHNNISTVGNEDFFQTEISCTMESWSICYDGTTNVKDFQSVVETLRLLHNVSKKQLIAAASTFFKDDALLWYRSRKHIFRDWDNLIFELVRNFSTVYDDETIWKFISNRFQYENEKLIFYISCMEHLLQRLHYLPSEQERVNIIKKNLLAPIRAALIFHEIYTVDQLLKIGRSVEKCYWSQNRYRF